MDAIRQAFADYFKNEDVTLPKKVPAKGKIEKGGWHIRYRLDEDDNGDPVLEFYADHRMTNPRYARITASGKVESLGSYQTAMVLKEDTPEGWADASRQMDEHNKALDKTLREKGLID